ncbi:hypothetical protein BC829DRAFT_390070 [Chytridium lagenaria]|nr:hypothetical protein BC829DRAFT_390070 [Chytridium lagenaria]
MLRSIPRGSRRRRQRDPTWADETGSVFSSLSRNNSVRRRSDTPGSSSAGTLYASTSGTLYEGVGQTGPRHLGSLGRDSTLPRDDGYDSPSTTPLARHMAFEPLNMGRSSPNQRPGRVPHAPTVQGYGSPRLANPDGSDSGLSNDRRDRPDPVNGPPIVVWLMDLTTNIGNVHYAAGEVKEAERWHTACLALAEGTLEKYPIMATAPQPSVSDPISPTSSTPSVLPQRSRKKRPLPINFLRVRLSYLHRACLQAKSRSLTHLALCQPTVHQSQDTKRPSHAAAAAIASLLASSMSSSRNTPRLEGVTRADTFRSLQAAVAANSAVAWTQCVAMHPSPGGVGTLGGGNTKASGLYRALERLETAARLYRSAGDEFGVARVEATLGALCVEVGRAVDGVRWARRFAVKDEDGKEIKEKVGKAGREAGPGRMWIEKGVKLLHIQIESLKGARDWWGMTAALANLGIAYTLLNQPHLALHFLSRVMDPADPPSTLSISVGPSPLFHSSPPPPNPVPTPLLQGIRVALWQALAALASTGRPPWYPAPETTGLPAPPTSEPVNALIRFITGNERADVVHLTLQGLDDLLLRPFKDRRIVRSWMWASAARLSVDDINYRLRMLRRCLDLDVMPVVGPNGEPVSQVVVRDPITAILSLELPDPSSASSQASESTNDESRPFRVALASPAVLCLSAEELSRTLVKDPQSVLSLLSLKNLIDFPKNLAQTAAILWARRLGVCEECCLADTGPSLGVSPKVVYVGPAMASTLSSASGAAQASPKDNDTEKALPAIPVEVEVARNASQLSKSGMTMKFPCAHMPWKNTEFV